MTGLFRTASMGRLRGAKPISFSFDGKAYQGVEGDTLASALLANGVHLVGRSYKYHRPRGILTAGAEEPNALVSVARGPGRITPNLRAMQVALFDGLIASSQNRFPSLAFDIGAINQLAGKVFSAGFYYKTFMGPKMLGGTWLWRKVFEPVIRRAAGLGAAPTAPDPDRYAQFYGHCDVLIIGAGPAGLAAALSAGASGARVILCDEQQEPGGSLLSEHRAEIDGLSAQGWIADTIARLKVMPNIRLLPRTQAFGYFAQNFIGLNEQVSDHLGQLPDDAPRERMWRIRAKEVVLAAGAIERPLVFPGNDRPGVMLAGAGYTYLERYGVLPGRQVVVTGTNDTIYRAALALNKAGADVIAVDHRTNPSSPLAIEARTAGIRIICGEVAETRGRLRISSAEIREADGSVITLPCDCLLMSGGWVPSVHLFSQSRGKLVFDATRGIYIPGVSVQNERSAGACRGVFALNDVLDDGAKAGREAAEAAGSSSAAQSAIEVTNAPTSTGEPYHPRFAAGKAFVDQQNDVTADDIALAVREGMHSIEHVKRYTTTGMATDQGKLSNMNALALAAQALGRSIPEVGLTTFRQPYTPVSFGSFAGAARGDLFDPVRQTPIHNWAAEQGAAFEDVGLWKRAWYFPQEGEDMHQAVARECRQTRASAGFFDASTLGKIEIVGPDAAAFLEKIYTNPFAKLEIGRCRYGLMLSEAGFVMDDGVVARLAPDRFHITTTTSGAPRVLNHMEDYLQTEFPEMRVWLTSTTEQWAVIAIQGPKAREIISPFVEGIDLSDEAMPHMSVRDGKICGVSARLMRVSFTGELGFEVNVPPSQARGIWEALWAEGRKYDAVAYGTEAMHVMRAEKGYIIIGQETDGTVTPGDLGLDWALGKAKPDFVGKRGLFRPDLMVPGRKQLVGLLTDDPHALLDEGAQITGSASPIKGEAALGHVTSSYFSPTMGRSIALALVSDGRNRMGEHFYVTGKSEREMIGISLTSPVFFDQKGECLNG